MTIGNYYNRKIISEGFRYTTNNRMELLAVIVGLEEIETILIVIAISILNFGLTIGHALESYFLNTEKILHGIAVIMGIICESWISSKINGLSIYDYENIISTLSGLYTMQKKKL